MAEKLILEIELVSSKSDKAFKDVENQAKMSGKKAGDNFKKGINASGVTTSLAGIAKGFVGVTLAVVGLRKALTSVGDAFRNLREFGRGVAEINSILPRNAKLTEFATQELIEFSKQFGTDQQRQARAFYNIVSAGVKGTEKQLRTLAVANKAAVAGLVDIDTAARVIVSSVNAYSKAGLTAKQASDALFVAVREGQTTFGELSDTVGNVTAIASNAGVEFDELAGSIAFITKSGIKTDLAVTGLRQVFAAVIKPTKEAADEAKRLGLEFSTTALRSKNLAGFLKEVQDKTRGNEQSLSKLFGNIRALGPVLNIVNGNFEEYQRILGETARSQGATSEAAQILSKTLDFKIDQTIQEFKALALNLIGTLKPAFLEVVEAAQFVGRTFNKVFRVESTKPLDVLNRKLSKTANEINNLIDARERRKKGFFGFQTDEDERQVKIISGQIDALKNKRRELLKDRADLLSARRSLANKEVEIEKNKNEEIQRNELAADAFSKALIQNTSEFIVQQEDIKLQRLQELRENDLISEQMLQEARLQVREETEQKLLALEEQRVANATISFESLAAAFKVNSKKMKFTAIELAKTMQTTFANGIGNAFQSVGAAMREGKSEMEAFEQAMAQMFANLASQAGDFYIAKGLALLADPATSASGSKMIAAGAGLKVLAGLLGAQGAGAGASGGSAGGVSDGGNVTEPVAEEDLERQTTSEININVEGSLVQQEELGQFIAEVQSEINQKNGTVVVSPRFA